MIRACEHAYIVLSLGGVGVYENRNRGRAKPCKASHNDLLMGASAQTHK